MALNDIITSADVEEETRTVFVGGKRRAVSFEPILWRTLEDIAAIERLTLGELLSRINDLRRNHTLVSLSSAVMVFLTRYMRQKADFEEFTVPAPDPHLEIRHYNLEESETPEEGLSEEDRQEEIPEPDQGDPTSNP